jgi:hypothetical protein
MIYQEKHFLEEQPEEGWNGVIKFRLKEPGITGFRFHDCVIYSDFRKGLFCCGVNGVLIDSMELYRDINFKNPDKILVMDDVVWLKEIG